MLIGACDGWLLWVVAMGGCYGWMLLGAHAHRMLIGACDCPDAWYAPIRFPPPVRPFARPGVLTAINTVYHALGVRLCPLQHELCDAQSILEFEFPEPNCDGWSNPNLVSVKPGLGLEDLFGPFMILATLWIFGILFGRLASEHPEWRGLSWWTLSPVARDIKAATMIHREREAAVRQLRHHFDRVFKLCAARQASCGVVCCTLCPCLSDADWMLIGC